MPLFDAVVIAGADGCRTGWVICRRDTDGSLDIRVVKTLAEACEGLSILAVDMPIGLTDMPRPGRACEGEARALVQRQGIQVGADIGWPMGLLGHLGDMRVGLVAAQRRATPELVARGVLGQLPQFFEVKRYRVTVERRKNKYNDMVTLSEAVVVVKIGGEKVMSVSDSMDEDGADRGPVTALA